MDKPRMIEVSKEEQDLIWAEHASLSCPMFYIDAGRMYVEAEQLRAWRSTHTSGLNKWPR